MRKSNQGDSLESSHCRKKSERIVFHVTPDMKAAMKRRGAFLYRNISNYVKVIVREDLIKADAELRISGFPIEQSLELWVWAKQKAFRAGAILPMPHETLCEVRDGEKIIRFDFQTVDGRRFQILEPTQKKASAL